MIMTARHTSSAIWNQYEMAESGKKRGTKRKQQPFIKPLSVPGLERKGIVVDRGLGVVDESIIHRRETERWKDQRCRTDERAVSADEGSETNNLYIKNNNTKKLLQKKSRCSFVLILL